MRGKFGRRAAWILSGSVMAVVIMSGSTLAAPTGASEFYVPKPNPDAIDQIATLRASGNKADADLIQWLVDQPSAVWFTSGSPKDVEQSVKATVQRAAAKQSTPCARGVQRARQGLLAVFRGRRTNG